MFGPAWPTDFAVRGRLIKWAREQQRLTMRQVFNGGGPVLAYQSEIENEKKGAIASHKLSDWIRVLKVTEPFVRGQIPRYIDNPNACRGLASEIGNKVLECPQDWVLLAAGERARRVLYLVSTESRQVPKVVLAYVLGLELEALEAQIAGTFPVTQFLIKALSDLTLLPETFFTLGILKSGATPGTVDPDYFVAIEVAIREGLTPSDLVALVKASKKTVLETISRAVP